MTRKEMIYQMFLTQFNILSAEIDEYQRNIRYRKVTSTDCYELMVAIERFQMLKEMQAWIFKILQIDEDEEFERLFKHFEKQQADRIKF